MSFEEVGFTPRIYFEFLLGLGCEFRGSQSYYYE